MWTLIGGFESKHDQLYTAPTFARVANNAGYLQLLTRYGDRFFLASNVRYDANDQFGSRATFRVAPSFHVPWTETILKGSYGTGFKPPSLNQLHVDFPAFNFFGNPNLKPEESTGYDIGFEQPLFNDVIRAGATYYQNNITDLININETFTSLTNIGRAKTYGCEAFSAFTITPELNFRLDYTFTIARDEIADLELLRRPRNKLSMQAAWIFNRQAFAFDDACLRRHLYRWQSRFLDSAAQGARLHTRQSRGELRGQRALLGLRAD